MEQSWRRLTASVRSPWMPWLSQTATSLQGTRTLQLSPVTWYGHTQDKVIQFTSHRRYCQLMEARQLAAQGVQWNHTKRLVISSIIGRLSIIGRFSFGLHQGTLKCPFFQSSLGVSFFQSSPLYRECPLFRVSFIQSPPFYWECPFFRVPPFIGSVLYSECPLFRVPPFIGSVLFSEFPLL